MSQTPQILLHQVSFSLPDGRCVLNPLSLSLSTHKIGIVGKNGVGKSTVFKLITGELAPTQGNLDIQGTLFYVPQTPLIPTGKTVADFFDLSAKLLALQHITSGQLTEHDLTILDEDWMVGERLKQALQYFGLEYLNADHLLSKCSGGELTRLALSKAFLSSADFLLLDEPTNHLDSTGRQQLYHAITQWRGGVIVISHDRTLLNLIEKIIELTTLGAMSYGGNYDAYQEQKSIEEQARLQHLEDAQKQLKKAELSIQSTFERHQQKQSYGRALRKSGSIDTMSADSKQGRSERSQNRMLIKGERMIQEAETQLATAKEKIEILEEIHIDLPKTNVPSGKMILEIDDLNFSYLGSQTPLIQAFNLTLQGPERVALLGPNGSGKTTLIQLLLEQLTPSSGKITRGTQRISYLDQHLNFLDADLSVLENLKKTHPEINDTDAHRCLAHFLFRNVTALKKVKHLSGGERLRAALACTFMQKEPPQLLILDEPTNHLDLQSLLSLESALNSFQGAMIVISHDQKFLDNLSITRKITLP